MYSTDGEGAVKLRGRFGCGEWFPGNSETGFPLVSTGLWVFSSSETAEYGPDMLLPATDARKDGDNPYPGLRLFRAEFARDKCEID